MDGVGAYSTVASEIMEREAHERWEDKEQNVVWRGKKRPGGFGVGGAACVTESSTAWNSCRIRDERELGKIRIPDRVCVRSLGICHNTNTRLHDILGNFASMMIVQYISKSHTTTFKTRLAAQGLLSRMVQH